MDALQVDARHSLRFQSLRRDGQGFAFPCDAAGHVDIDALDERARNDYFYARTVVGREFRSPAVELTSRDGTRSAAPR